MVRSLRLLLPWCLHGRALSLAARTIERDHARLLLGAGPGGAPDPSLALVVLNSTTPQKI